MGYEWPHQNSMSLLSYINIIPCFLLLCGAVYIPSAMGSTCMLDDDFVYQRAVEQSDDLKLAMLREEELRNDLGDFNAIYDASLNTQLSHQIDKSERVIDVFGTRNDITNFQSSINKTLDIGVNLEAGFRHRREKTDGPFVTINPAYNSVWFGSISVPLLNSVQRNNEILRSSFESNISGVSLNNEFVTQQIGYNALQTYSLWYQAKAEIELSQQALKRAEEYYQTSQNLYRDRLIEKSSLFAAKTNVSVRKQDVIATKNNFSRLDQELKYLLRIEHDQTCNTEDFSIPDHEQEQAYLAMIQERPDIQAFDKQIESLQIATDSFENNLKPTADVFTSLEINDVDGNFENSFGNSFTGFDNPNWTIGGQITVPFGRSAAKTDIERSRIQIESITVDKSNTLRKIERDIRNAFSTVVALKKRIDEVSKTIEYEKSVITETRKEYELGRESILTLLIYEQDFVEIKRGLVSLKAQLKNQLYLLELLSGDLNLSKAS